MNNSMEKLEKLRGEIESDSKKDAETLVAQAKKNAEENVSAVKERLKAQFESDTARVTGEYRDAQRKRISEKHFIEERRSLAFRSELTDSFFAEIERELSGLTASDKYGGYLSRCAEKANERSPLDGSVTVYCRTEDVPAVKKAFSGYGVKIGETKDIRLGGLLLRREGHSEFLDMTFDTALEQERESFSSMKELQL